MVVLGRVEDGCRFDFGDHGALTSHSLCPRDALPGHLALLSCMWIQPMAILRPPVIAHTVQRGRVHSGDQLLAQCLVADQRRVKYQLDTLRVARCAAADLRVGRAVDGALGVANACGHHPWQPLEMQLGAPELRMVIRGHGVS